MERLFATSSEQTIEGPSSRAWIYIVIALAAAVVVLIAK
jgi:hypothetical protein